MEHLIKLIEVLVWPATLLFLVWWGRKPLQKLLPYIENVRYKDFEIRFRQRLGQVKEDVGEEALARDTKAGDTEELYKLIEISTQAAIVEYWKKVESAAKGKIHQLLSEERKRNQVLRRPIDYLEYTGALIPSTVRAVREMRNLRNQVVHSESTPISKEAAIEYATLANAIAYQIEGITELPQVKLTALTLLILELNHLIDAGEFNDISIDEVYSAIENKNILPFLKERTKGKSDFSLYSEDGPYSGFADFYHEQMQRMYYGYSGDHRRKWGVENLGLCLLLAWTNELVQQGAGWYPDEL